MDMPDGAPAPSTAEPASAGPAKRGPFKGDLTQGPIMPTLLLFSVPTLLANVLQSLNGTINSIWVGRLIGEEALAATANANIIMFLMASAVFGLSAAKSLSKTKVEGYSGLRAPPARGLPGHR